MSQDLTPRVRVLLNQIISNQNHERHLSAKETAYWCNQWKILAIRLGVEIKTLAAPRNDKNAQEIARLSKVIRRAVKRISKNVSEIDDLLDPLLEVADSLDRMAWPTVVVKKVK